jgi:ATP-dependent protease HslVU (ClpYQ) ATPase subunit
MLSAKQSINIISNRYKTKAFIHRYNNEIVPKSIQQIGYALLSHSSEISVPLSDILKKVSQNQS